MSVESCLMPGQLVLPPRSQAPGPPAGALNSPDPLPNRGHLPGLLAACDFQVTGPESGAAGRGPGLPNKVSASAGQLHVKE